MQMPEPAVTYTAIEHTDYVALVNEARRALLDQSVTAITVGIKETVDIDDSAEVWQFIIDRLFGSESLDKPRNPFIIAKYKVEISVHDQSIKFETEYSGTEEELEQDIYDSLDIETSATYTINLNMGNTNESIEVTDNDGITVDEYDFRNHWVEVFITKI